MDSDSVGFLYAGAILVLGISLLHIFYQAACTGVTALGGRLSGKVEQYPALNYFLEHKTKHRMQSNTEHVAYGITMEIVLCTAAWAQIGQKTLSWTQFFLSIVVVFFLALVLVAIADGIGHGIGRKLQIPVICRLVCLVRVLHGILLPVYLLTAGIDRCIAGKLLAQKVTEEEIMQLVNAGNATGVIEEQQREMIHNIFAFDDRPVSEVMTHRKELVSVEVETEMEQVVDLARSERYSRMPVYQDTIDNVIGMLNTKDLLGLIGCKNITGFHVRDFMREAIFVPETAKCDDVLSEMLRKKIQMGIVVDEYGGTAGAVCMEDILEEIVGNIQDEYDDEEQQVHRITDALYTIDGQADPEEVLPILGLTLPEEMEFDTMSGFVVELLGRIPEQHENPSVQLERVRFTVLAMEDNWVSKIKAEIS